MDSLPTFFPRQETRLMKPGRKTHNRPTITKSAGSPARVGSRPTSSAPASLSKPAAETLKPTSKVEWKPGTREPTQQAIAEAAYFLWRERGGSEVVNWLEAEARLRRQAQR
jgi:hypothetical protein